MDEGIATLMNTTRSSNLFPSDLINVAIPLNVDPVLVQFAS